MQVLYFWLKTGLRIGQQKKKLIMFHLQKKKTIFIKIIFIVHVDADNIRVTH